MLSLVLMLLLSSGAQAPPVAAPPAFKATSIVSGLGMGYQLVLADLNRDKRLDVIVVDERAQDLAWYENPTWTRHVLTTAVPRVINLDTHDLDGDGIPEIALAHRFETDPARSVGQVLLLTHGDDPAQHGRHAPSTPCRRRIACGGCGSSKEGAVAHRRAVRGRGRRRAQVRGTDAHLRIPSRHLDARSKSRRPSPASCTASTRWSGRRDAGNCSRRVSMVCSGWCPKAGEWTHVPLTSGNVEPCPRCGSSEIKIGALGQRRFLATIEPFHGTNVVVYLDRPSGWDSLVIERGMTNGHALAVADLDGDGRDEIIGGFRGKDFRITIYRANDATGTRWTPTVLDEGHVAGADCKVADLTGDGRLDIVCSGASTGNVMLFEQQPRP